MRSRSPDNVKEDFKFTRGNIEPSQVKLCFFVFVVVLGCKISISS